MLSQLVQPNLESQPNDHLKIIMRYLGGQDLLICHRVSRRLATFAQAQLPETSELMNASLAKAVHQVNHFESNLVGEGFEMAKRAAYDRMVEQFILPGVTKIKFASLRNNPDNIPVACNSLTKPDDIKLIARTCGKLLTTFCLNRSLYVPRNPEPNRTRDDEAMEFLAEHCPRLRRLFIDHRAISGRAIRAIVRGCTSLQIIEFRNCNVQDAGIACIPASVLGARGVIDIDHCGVTDAGVQDIAQRCTKVRSLNARGCKLVRSIAPIVNTNGSTLRIIYLSGCPLIADQAVLEIAHACHALKVISLMRCELITDLSIVALVTECPKLKSIHLEFCRQITNTSVVAISERCQDLGALYLDCTQASDTAIVALATKCPRLKALSLYGCVGVTDLTLNSLAVHSPELTALDLLRSSVTAAAMRAFQLERPNVTIY